MVILLGFFMVYLICKEKQLKMFGYNCDQKRKENYWREKCNEIKILILKRFELDFFDFKSFVYLVILNQLYILFISNN